MNQEEFERFIAAALARFDGDWAEYCRWANDNPKEAAEWYACFGKPRVKGSFPNA
jgi:hypothetical protein